MGPDTRFEVVTAIARKDPAWARQLIEQILKDFENDEKDRKDLDKTRELDSIMRVAIDSVRVNPALSQQLFRRAMRFPLDSYWYFALYSVAEADQDLAYSLYNELLINYRNETPRRLLLLSAFPFGSERIMGADQYGYGTSIPALFRADEAAQQSFIRVFLDRVVAFASAEESLAQPTETYRHPESVYAMTALQQIEPIVIAKFPGLLQLLSRARASAESLLSDDARKQLKENEKFTSGLGRSFEQRIRELEEADAEGKLTDQMIASLLTWGKKTEPQFKQLETWLDKIKDEKIRQDSTSYFWFLRAKLAVEEKRIEEAEKLARKVPEKEHRVVLAFDIAEAQLSDLNDRASVYQTLAEVSKLAQSMDDSGTKARVLLGLASQYEKFNHVFAMDELSDAIRVLNRIENPDIFSTSVIRQIQGKTFSFFAVYGMPGYDLEATFRSLSKNDFNLSLSNAKAINDNYLRTIAVIAVAQNCQSNKPPKKGKQPNNLRPAL